MQDRSTIFPCYSKKEEENDKQPINFSMDIKSIQTYKEQRENVDEFTLTQSELRNGFSARFKKDRKKKK
ncbi:MAG: hypothetical protein ACFE9L_17540 [Candidatus Hodarchaeota archaeon]